VNFPATEARGVLKLAATEFAARECSC
jgi:hypothetical protein